MAFGFFQKMRTGQTADVAWEEERAMAMLVERMKQPLPVDEAWRLIRDTL